MMKRRGLSEVISVVLMILIVLVAIAIVWSFVNPTISKIVGSPDNKGEVGNLLGCIDLSLEVNGCGILDSGDYRVKVSRGSGQFDFKELVFKFTNSTGEFTIRNNSNFPGEFGSLTYNFNLSSYTSDLDSVEVAAVLKDGNTCGFIASGGCLEGFVDNGNGNNGNGTGESQELSYCAPLDIPPQQRVGPGPKESLEFILNQYPSPANFGVTSVPVVTDVSLNGVSLKKITFNFKPFKDSYPGAPFDGKWEREATVYVPVSNANKNAIVVSMQTGTGAGQTGDITRTSGEIPSWFKGTDTNDNFMKTYAVFASNLKIPIAFSDAVPNTIRFTPEIRDQLRLINEQSNPSSDCDWNLCDGKTLGSENNVLNGDSEIHHCLQSLSLINYPEPPGSEFYIYHMNTAFYSAVSSRLVDATQAILNNPSYYTGGQFDFGDSSGNVFVMGGSKRGAGSGRYVLSEDRVKGAMVNAANVANFIENARQGISLYANTPDYIYESSSDDFNYFSSLLAQSSDWFERYDPAYIDPNVVKDKRLLYSWGLEDSYFQTSAESLYLNSLPAETQFLGSPDLPHTTGNVDLAVAFKNLVDDYVNNKPLLNISAHWDFNTNKIYARISGVIPNQTIGDRVELWCDTKRTDDEYNSVRNFKEDHIFNGNLLSKCSSVPNDWFKFVTTPLSPNMVYSNMSKTSMVYNSSSGLFEAPPLPIEDNSWEQGYQACIVRVMIKGNNFDGPVATSPLLLNKKLCDAALLPTVTK